MDKKTQLALAGVLKTLRNVKVSDGDDGNLMKMLACIGKLEEIIKEAAEDEGHHQQNNHA